MAKLGMPSINISFIEAGIEAIQRSQRGIVALILEEATDTITKLKTDHKVGADTAKAIENPFTIYTTDDIPPELSDDNKDYITKCLIGYTKPRTGLKCCWWRKMQRMTPRPTNLPMRFPFWLQNAGIIWPFLPLPMHSVKPWPLG